MRGILVAAVLALGLLPHPFSAAETQGPALGTSLPSLEFPMPADPADRAYLGLEGRDKTFSLSQVRGKVIILEIFSMYCPYCQREAPEVNRLYGVVQKDPGLRDIIKIMGVGPGNSPYEVGFFRKTYDIPFPLFADEKFQIHRLVGRVRTPYFLVLERKEDGSHMVLLSRLGGLKGAEAFLRLVLKLANIS